MGFETDVSEISKHVGFNVTGDFAGLDVHGGGIDSDFRVGSLVHGLVQTSVISDLRAQMFRGHSGVHAGVIGAVAYDLPLVVLQHIRIVANAFDEQNAIAELAVEVVIDLHALRSCDKHRVQELKTEIFQILTAQHHSLYPYRQIFYWNQSDDVSISHQAIFYINRNIRVILGIVMKRASYPRILLFLRNYDFENVKNSEYLLLHYFRMRAMPRNLAWHPSEREPSGCYLPHDPIEVAREMSVVPAVFFDNHSREKLKRHLWCIAIPKLPRDRFLIWHRNKNNGQARQICRTLWYMYRDVCDRIVYLPLVVTPFQLSLRARLCPIWLFPRAGKPQVAITTPANLRDDFAPEVLAAIFSLPGSKRKQTIRR